MRLRPFVTATSVALLLSALVPAASAPAVEAGTSAPGVTSVAVAKPKKPQVTIADLVASSEVGRKVKVSGTAKKSRSKKPVEVRIQRRYGAGPWSTVATDKTNKKGRYSARVPLTQGGPTAFRVKRAGGGTSTVETLAVYEWLNLADQPFLLGAGGGSTRITSVMGGRSYPESIELWTNNLAGLWSVAGCTAVDLWVGFTDRGRAELDPSDRVDIRLARTTASGAVEGAVTEARIPAGPGVHYALPLTARTTYFGINAIADTESFEPSADVVLGTPRARCNATALPPVRYADTPFPGSPTTR